MGVFGILYLLSLRVAIKEEIGRPRLWAIIWTVLYAVSDEFHQYFTPGRTGSCIDVLIDSLGVFYLGSQLILFPN